MPSTIDSCCPRIVELAGALLFLLASCAGPTEKPRHLPPAVAVEAFTRARDLRAAGVGPNDARLWSALAEARQAAPDWVAPRRLEDDLLRDSFLGVMALERRRVELAEDASDVRAQYLVARLEGSSALARFEGLARRERDFAWGLYASAWVRSRSGANGDIIGDWRRAVREARTPWEAAYFGRGLARYLMVVERPAEALSVMQELLEGLELRPTDRDWLESELAVLELRYPERGTNRRGYERGLWLIRSARLSPDALDHLVRQMWLSGVPDDPAWYRLELALESQSSRTRAALLAELWLERGDDGHARSIAMAQGDEGLVEKLQSLQDFAGRLRAGWYGEAVELWLDTLPAQVCDGDGLPLDPGLREMVLAGRALERAPADVEALVALGQCFLEIGWYREAQIMASSLRSLDREESARLRRSALAGRTMLFELRRALGAVQRNEPDFRREAVGAAAGKSTEDAGDELDLLLGRWGRAFADSEALRGGPANEHSTVEALVHSPRLVYGVFAELVHPGPWFSAADELAGLGIEGEPVPGLAREMARHNRFAVVGQALLDAPDGIVLKRIWVEEEAGEHLGAPWKGTIVWCAGADVLSKAQRSGGEIGGAAVHEGYWIDIGMVRGSYERWQALPAQLFADLPVGHSRKREAEHLERILSTRGLRLRTSPSQPRARARERTAIVFPLGQATRQRLAVLRDRAGPGEVIGELPFSEFVELINHHEEGHLCDRSRFLPLSSHVGRWLGFALDNGFSPVAIQQRLEYRAQLVALCTIEDPRLALVDLLMAAENKDDLGLGHGPAYRQLLGDLLGELDSALMQDPSAWPRLSTEHTLIHQLHHLSGEQVRELGRVLARREGLFG